MLITVKVMFLAVKVVMRLYICAGLSELPLQLPSGSGDLLFCRTLLLSVFEQ